MIVSSSLRALAAAGERARVDVDDRHRLGVVDHQVAAARQVHPAPEHRLDRLLHAVALEQRLVVLVELEPLEQLRRGAGEERLEPVVLLLVVDDRLLELAREDVARHAHRQVGLLEDHLRRRASPSARCWSTSWSLCRYLISRSKSSRFAPCAAVRTIAPPSPRSILPAARAQPVALLVVEPARHADALALRHVHEVAPRDRELHRQARALRLQRVLDRLDQDLLAGLQELGDPLALAGAAAAAPAARDLDAREDDVVRVEEAVLVEADVHERGLEAGQDVVDLALVDVSDDRAVALALDVELGNAPIVLALTLLLPLTSGGGALRFQDGDSGFASVHRDEQLLSQEDFPS